MKCQPTKKRIPVLEDGNPQMRIGSGSGLRGSPGEQEQPEVLPIGDAVAVEIARSGLAPTEDQKTQISAVDEAIGNLTRALRARGMWENTLHVFSSDNVTRFPTCSPPPSEVEPS